MDPIGTSGDSSYAFASVGIAVGCSGSVAKLLGVPHGDFGRAAPIILDVGSSSSSITSPIDALSELWSADCSRSPTASGTTVSERAHWPLSAVGADEDLPNSGAEDDEDLPYSGAEDDEDLPYSGAEDDGDLPYSGAEDDGDLPYSGAEDDEDGGEGGEDGDGGVGGEGGGVCC